MLILTELEARIYEAIKSDMTFKECELLLSITTRTLTTTCQKLVELDILHRLKAKHYVALPATYEIKPIDEVKKHRKTLIKSIANNPNNPISDEAAIYIIGHYYRMSRTKLLNKLREAGYNIAKFELNEFILNNKIDKLPRC